MSVPKYDDMMNPTIAALRGLGGSASVTEIEESVAKLLKLSNSELNDLHRGNVTKFTYRLAWSRNYLKRYGLIENSSRGVWALTAKGLSVKKVDKIAVKRHVKLLDDSEREIKKLTDLTETPETKLNGWKEQLLLIVKNISPDSFERLCQRVLRESGFVQVEVTGKSGDGGIDGTGIGKIGGLLSFHVVFQCKRYNQSVPPKVVRDLRGAMIGRADKGLILTTGTFSRAAKLESIRDGAPPIDLIDGYALADKLKELELGVSVKTVATEKITIDESWFRSI